MKNEMSNEEFLKILESMSQDETDELFFQAMGGKKRKKNYIVDTYYKGLGYYIGGLYWNEVEKQINEMGKIKTEDGEERDACSGDLDFVKKAQEKYGVKYENEIMSGDNKNPFIQFFVCNADDMRLF